MQEIYGCKRVLMFADRNYDQLVEYSGELGRQDVCRDHY